MRSVENEEWKMRSVGNAGNAECGKWGVWKVFN